MASFLQHILVTGAAGAVGEETLKALLRRSDRYRVTAFDLPTKAARRRLHRFSGNVRVVLGDLTNGADVAKAVSDIDAVIHLGAVIPPLADREPERATRVNVNGTQTLLEAVEALTRPVRFLHASSVAVYGDRIEQPWIEVGDPICPSPSDHYARTKVEGEKLVRKSSTRWSIFRLTGVLSHRVSMDPIMFHMPLETPFESITARDAGYAMVKALGASATEGRIFNLGGGPRCRATYRQYLDRHLSIMGLGKGFFPDTAFGEGNFHCGYYRDSYALEALLHFQRDGLEEWFEEVERKLHPVVPIFARTVRPLIRWRLLQLSEPMAARRMGDPALLNRFRIG